jgi:hypothetical protein
MEALDVEPERFRSSTIILAEYTKSIQQKQREGDAGGGETETVDELKSDHVDLPESQNCGYRSLG